MGSFGAGNEARTRYLHLGKVALYQMSYARENKVYFNKGFPPCQALLAIFIWCKKGDLARDRTPPVRGNL